MEETVDDLPGLLNKFEDALEMAEDVYSKKTDAAWDEYRGTVVSAATDRCRKVDLAVDEYTRTREEAWQRVSRRCTDALTRQIVRECADDMELALLLLRARPTSVTELDDLANEHGWGRSRIDHLRDRIDWSA